MQPATSVVTGHFPVRNRSATDRHDLALLVDKLHPDARVDDTLVTLLPGETATFHVTSPVALDGAALTDRAVLKHAGQLVRP